jgi:hypothetical protein
MKLKEKKTSTKVPKKKLKIKKWEPKWETNIWEIAIKKLNWKKKL